MNAFIIDKYKSKNDGLLAIYGSEPHVDEMLFEVPAGLLQHISLNLKN